MKMKTLTKLILFVTLVSVVTLTGCKKNEEAVNDNGVLNVTGSDSNANQSSIILSPVNGVGTYKIGPSGGTGHQGRWTQGLNQTDSYVASFVIGTGEVTITELTDSKAKGTFKFTGYNTDQNTVQVTDGEFDVTF